MNRFFATIISITILIGNIGFISNAQQYADSENINLTEIINEAETLEPSTDAEEWLEEDSVITPVDCTSAEWKNYDTHQEMLEKCTIPEEVIEQISTQELLELVLQYPLLCDIYAYDDIQIGLLEMAKQYNGIRELVQREDMATVILEKYKEWDVLKDGSGSIEDFYQTTDLTLLEVLLAQSEIIRQLDNQEKNELLEEVKEKVEEKEQSDLYFGEESVFYDVVQNSKAEDELGVDIRVALDEVTNVKNITVKAASNTKTYVKTPNGSHVTVYKYDDMSKAQKQQINNVWKQKYPNAKFVSTATRKYNCHSYAWYKQSTSNTCWMPNPKKYYSDGSYREISKKNAKNNSKVIYKDAYNQDYHSGVLVDSSKQIVQSKWGQAPLMRHAVNYCPYMSGTGRICYYK